MLLVHSPHIITLQEARIPDHHFKAFRADIRAVGYMVHRDKEKMLVTIWRRGLNLAPLKDQPQEDNIRLRDFALALKSDVRIVLRNLHAPSGAGPAYGERRHMLANFGKENLGDLFCITGDFNQTIEHKEWAVAITPGVHTFRRAYESPYISSLDGALTSHLLAKEATATCIDSHSWAQPKPVLITLATAPLTHDFYR